MAKESKKSKKELKKEKPLKASIVVASCYGCGAPLQTSDSEAPGYVDTETYELVLIRVRLSSCLFTKLYFSFGPSPLPQFSFWVLFLELRVICELE